MRSWWFWCAGLLLAVATLNGCGGGGGAPPSSSGMDSVPQLSPDIPLSAYVWGDNLRPGAPVMSFGGTLHVGADVAPSSGALSADGMLGGVALSKGRVRDGVRAEDVVAWLKVAASQNLSEELTGLATFPKSEQKTVSFLYDPGAGPRRRLERLTRDAVEVINAALPLAGQLWLNPHTQFSLAPAPGQTEGRTIGEIVVRFLSKADPRYPEGADETELGRARVFFDVNNGVVDDKGGAFSEILIDPNAVGPLSDSEVIHVLVHELLHSLGFLSHTDPTRFSSTLSSTYSPGTLPRARIYPVDRDGLLAAYNRFDPGTLPADITLASLGPWMDTSYHLRGDIASEGIAFGVAFRNGLAQPWASGPRPGTGIHANSALSGTVTWTGALVGIGPSGREVFGEASLALGMETLQGQLDFTEMRFEGGGDFGDGDLGYAIRVDSGGNTFRRADPEFVREGRGYRWSGADLGTITGSFFGSGHEGMGGVLVRHDLSAAFGGKR